MIEVVAALHAAAVVGGPYPDGQALSEPSTTSPVFDVVVAGTLTLGFGVFMGLAVVLNRTKRELGGIPQSILLTRTT